MEADSSLNKNFGIHGTYIARTAPSEMTQLVVVCGFSSEREHSIEVVKGHDALNGISLWF